MRYSPMAQPNIYIYVYTIVFDVFAPNIFDVDVHYTYIYIYVYVGRIYLSAYSTLRPTDETRRVSRSATQKNKYIFDANTFQISASWYVILFFDAAFRWWLNKSQRQETHVVHRRKTAMPCCEWTTAEEAKNHIKKLYQKIEKAKTSVKELKKLANNKGVILVNFGSSFVNKESNKIYKEIDALEKTEVEEFKFYNYEEDLFFIWISYNSSTYFFILSATSS